MKLTKDTKAVVNKKWKHGSHDVSWCLFDIKGKYNVTKRIKDMSKIEGGRYGSCVCYAGLRSKITSKFYTHLVTDIPLDYYPKKSLTKKEMIDWITLSKKNKTLPNYISAKQVVGDRSSLNVTFKLRSVMSMPHLYVYLATVRYIKEDPGLVKIVLHLTKELGVDYFVAMSIGTYHAANQRGHNIMSYDPPYPVAGKAQDVTYNITESKALKLFVSDPRKYYKQTIVGDNFWNIHDVLKKLSYKEVTSKFENLKSKKVKEFIDLEDN